MFLRAFIYAALCLFANGERAARFQIKRLLAQPEKIQTLKFPTNSENYTENLDFWWIVSAEQKYKIHIKIENFDSERCCDTLKFYNVPGTTTRKSRNFRTIRGTNNDIEFVTDRHFVSFNFISDNDGNGKGFTLTYQATEELVRNEPNTIDDITNLRKDLVIQRNPTISNNVQSILSAYLFKNDQSFLISVHNSQSNFKDRELCGRDIMTVLPRRRLSFVRNFESINPDMECWWVLNAPVGYHVILIFSRISLGECCDSISIYNSRQKIDNSSSLIRKISGDDNVPIRVLSTGPVMSVRLLVKEGGVEREFRAYARIVRAASPTVKASTTRKTPAFKCGSPLGAIKQIRDLNSPGYPDLYGSNLDCEWKISAGLKQVVQLTIGDVETEECCDYLDIYESGKKIRRFGGKVTRNETFVSKSHEGFVVRFHTDASVNRVGFRSVYRSVLTSKPASSLHLPVECGLEMKARTEVQQLTSPNWPNHYPANLNCEWNITPDDDRTQVQFELRKSVTEACCDYIEIYDGKDTTKVAGSIEEKQVFTSKSGLIRVRFHSDYSVFSEGFVADFYQVLSVQRGEYPTWDRDLATCGYERIAGNTPQTFSSPNYPNVYDSNENCIWIFNSPSVDTFVELNILDFISEACCDYLEIYEGNRLVSTLAGKPNMPQQFTSHGHMFALLFHTDGSSQRSGFRANFRSVRYRGAYLDDTTNPRNERDCTYDIDVGYIPERLTSPGWPEMYFNSLNCTWAIKSPIGSQIKWNITRFVTEKNYDILKIGDGHNYTNEFSGTVNFTSSKSEQNALNISFKSDSNIRRGGFVIILAAEGIPTTTPTSTTTTTTATTTTTEKSTIAGPTTAKPGPGCGSKISTSGKSGRLLSRNYPLTYPDYENCSWTIEAGGGEVVQLVFEDIGMETCCDFIKVFDGNELRLISQINEPRRRREMIFTSTTNVMMVRFTSDQSQGGKGFLATYNAIAEPEVKNDVCGFTRVINESTTVFTSLNYPREYPPDSECHWLFETSDPSHQLEIVINDAHIEKCCDNIEIRDGKDRYAPVLQTIEFTVPSNNKLITTNKALYLIFRSDSSENFRGFQASIKSVDTTKYAESCHDYLIMKAGSEILYENNKVITCPEKSVCLTMSAEANYQNSISKITGITHHGTCVPIKYCESKDCRPIINILEDHSYSDVVVTSCNASCCDSDSCNLMRSEDMFVPDSTTASPTTPDSLGCYFYDLDVMFLIDGSGSISTGEFALQLQFLENVLKNMDLERIHVGVMQYSHWYRRRPITAQSLLQTHVRIGQFSSKETLKARIKAIRRHGYTSFTAHAIEKAITHDLRLSSRFADLCTKKAIVVVTDGSASDSSYFRNVIPLARGFGISMLAVGIKDYQQSELLTIAGSDSRVFTAENFSALQDLVPIVYDAVVGLV